MSNTLHAECRGGVPRTVREMSHCLESGHPELWFMHLRAQWPVS